jgi:hypothetical protein
MKLSEYIKSLQDFVKKDPRNAELTVVYSADDEGNAYQEVHYSPTIGEYIPDDREWRAFADDPDQDPEDMVDESDINSICIN